MGGSQDILEMKFSDFPCLRLRFSSNFQKGKDRCGGVRRAKLLRKRDWNGKQPSMRSTKETTVKLEKLLAV
jgi:hypothetical protein